MLDAMNNLIKIGDIVLVGETGTGSDLMFARVKAVGSKRVTLERIEGHPNTIPTWVSRSTREHKNVLVVQL